MLLYHPESECVSLAKEGEEIDMTELQEISLLDALRAKAGGATFDLPPTFTLTRRDPEHVYLLNDMEVPSVSSIIEHMIDFRFVKAEVLERSRDYGSKVHKTIELFEQGRLNRDTLHPKLAGPLKGWIAWKKDFGYKPCGFEVPVAHLRYRYAGTMDSYGVLCDSTGRTECALIPDLKTGLAYAAHKLQTAGYKKAAEHMGLVPPDTKRGSLYLSEDGDYDWKWHPNEIDEACFLNLAHAKHWEIHHGK
jgi:hypothetical protein